MTIVSDQRSAQRGVRGALGIAVHLGSLGGLKHALAHDEDGKLAVGLDQPGRAETTGLAERAAISDRLPEPPRLPLEEIGPSPPRAFWPSVSWSLVMARVASALSTAPPPLRSMRANASRSSAAETRPAPLSPKAGGWLQVPSGLSQASRPGTVSSPTCAPATLCRCSSPASVRSSPTGSPPPLRN